jgi:bud emergence protein 1
VNVNTGSAAAPTASNVAYIKIKIYDRATDDIIALRVHPATTYAELLDKVRTRLGQGINVLEYCINGTGGALPNACRRIWDDRELVSWMRSDARLVLYAEEDPSVR